MRRALLAVSLAVASLIAVGCGHRGRPAPPLPHVPETPENVEWHQRGDRLVINATYELRRLGGAPLKGEVRPVVLVFSAPTEDLARGWDTPSRDREFQRVAQPVLLPSLDAGARGEGRRLRRRDEIRISTFGEASALVLALALEDERGRSIPSPRRVLNPERPSLNVVEGGAVEPEETRVVVRWVAPSDDRVGKVRVYRQAPDLAPEPATAPWVALATVDAKRGRYEDEDVAYGNRYRYGLVATREGAGIPVESSLLVLDELEYVDRFPPLPAQDLEAVPESGAIRVLWFPGGSRDEASAVVQRQVEGGEGWDDVGEVASPDADFIDRDVSLGRAYRYRVVAIDRSGNRAEPTEPSRLVSPRSSASSSAPEVER